METAANNNNNKTALDKAAKGAEENGTKTMKSNGNVERSYGPSTRATHSGTKPAEWAHSPIMPPLYFTTTFEVLEPGKAVYDYSRSDNPTRTELQKFLASLESTRFALAFSSGLGAITTLTYLLESGQHILSCDDVYGGTFRLFSRCVSRMGIETSYVDGTKLDEWARHFRKGQTKLVWIETPTNPTLTIIDIKAVVGVVKALDPECVVVVDNTFITPVFQSPIKLGADIVMHSCSKYISGHSDIIMGALMLNNAQLYDRLKFLQNSLGITPSAYDCSLIIRHIKTLEIRVRQQTKNAQIIAEFLEAHPKVERVLYPGLESHPQHELAGRQSSGFGAMLSFYLKSLTGDEPAKFMRAVRLFHPAESLGCVCSLIEVPALMTHASVPKDNRLKLGITDNMMRVSVGIENVEDLVHDLDQAFKSVYDDCGKSVVDNPIQ